MIGNTWRTRSTHCVPVTDTEQCRSNIPKLLCYEGSTNLDTYRVSVSDLSSKIFVYVAPRGKRGVGVEHRYNQVYYPCPPLFIQDPLNGLQSTRLFFVSILNLGPERPGVHSGGDRVRHPTRLSLGRAGSGKGRARRGPRLPCVRTIGLSVHRRSGRKNQEAVWDGTAPSGGGGRDTGRWRTAEVQLSEREFPGDTGECALL